MQQTSHDVSDHSRLRLLEAIARRVLVTAAYNGQRLALAPHALFARRGELHTTAVNLSKNWRADETVRLGTFKLSGLGSVELTDEPFEVVEDGGPLIPREDDELLLAVS